MAKKQKIKKPEAARKNKRVLPPEPKGIKEVELPETKKSLAKEAKSPN